MKNPIKILLKPHKEEPIRRFHPWVFSGAIAKMEAKAKDGEVVWVADYKGNVLATGHYHDGNIAVRLFAFEAVIPNADFWYQSLQQAFAMRQRLNLTDTKNTNAYRLIHGEGDGLSGLVIDIYDSVAVVQAHSIGMYQALEDIAAALVRLYGSRLTAVYNKSELTLPEDFTKTTENGYLYGHSSCPLTILENGYSFSVNWETGQKTGFFLDQRDNRALLKRFVADKTVLNAFCYSGGFSVYALQAGAKKVVSVDVSQKAMDLTDKNIALNGLQTAHESITADVMPFLKNSSEEYEVMVLDPPAFAKNMNARHRAVQGYKRLNAEGLKRIKTGGILFTFSCSQVIDTELFTNTMVAAALEAKKQVRILHRLSQPADHPVNMFHPEGNYLKGLVLYVS